MCFPLAAESILFNAWYMCFPLAAECNLFNAWYMCFPLTAECNLFNACYMCFPLTAECNLFNAWYMCDPSGHENTNYTVRQRFCILYNFVHVDWITFLRCFHYCNRIFIFIMKVFIIYIIHIFDIYMVENIKFSTLLFTLS